MPEVRNLWAESEFVKTNCCEQVDFCPFRGPDAPFALRLSYHREKRSRHYGRTGPVAPAQQPARPGVALVLRPLAWARKLPGLSATLILDCFRGLPVTHPALSAFARETSKPRFKGGCKKK